MPGSATERTVTLPHPALSGADWADAWTATPRRRFDTARQAAEAVHRATPGWVGPLMGLRTLAVAPFGLKSGLSNRDLAPADRIGLFAVRDDSGDRVVVGMDDRHLDFRCVLDLDEADGQGPRDQEDHGGEQCPQGDAEAHQGCDGGPRHHGTQADGRDQPPGALPAGQFGLPDG